MGALGAPVVRPHWEPSALPYNHPMSFRSFWDKNKDDLGKEIFRSLVFKLFGLFELVWLGLRTVYAFVSPHMTERETLVFWGITAVVAISGLGLACVAFYFLFIKDYKPNPTKVLGEREDSETPAAGTVPPLSFEAQHILAVVVNDDHLSLLGTRSFGQKGVMYNADSAIICDGMDAKQSARYEAATRELVSWGYLSKNGEGVFSMTAEGVAAAEKLSAQALPARNNAVQSTPPAPPSSTPAAQPYLDIRLKVHYADDPESGEKKPYLVAEIVSPLQDAEVRDVYLEIPQHESVRPGWAALPMQGFKPGENLTCTLPRNAMLTAYFARRVGEGTVGQIIPPSDYYHAPWGQVDEARCVVVKCLGLTPQESIANAPLKELKDWVARYKLKGDPRFRGRDGKGGFRSGGDFKPYR
jgi:hypothetical protein